MLFREEKEMRRPRILWGFVALFFFLAAGPAQPGGPTFDLRIDAPAALNNQTAGATVQVEAVARLASSGIVTEDGAQGWSVSLEATGWRIAAATTDGTAADLRNTMDSESSFLLTEILGGGTGVVSTVGLDLVGSTTLAPSGEVDILRVTLEGVVPEPVDFDCVPAVCELAYVNGGQGSGEPVENLVTYRGESFFPSLGSSETSICPFVERETAFRADVPGAVSRSAKIDKVRYEYTLEVPAPATGTIPVPVHIFLDSELEACLGPAMENICTNGENFFEEKTFVYGCADEVDNDGNGVSDSDDPDCNGIQGWSFSIVTDPCYNIRSTTVGAPANRGATTVGTVGDLNTNPPGLRDPSGSFEKTERVNPADPPINAGRQGAVSAVVLAFTNPVILPQIGASHICTLNGDVNVSSIQMEGDTTAPCNLTFLDPDDDGLAGSGEPVKTAVTVAGETAIPNLCHATIIVRGLGLPLFRRGDSNDDGRVNIADAVWIANEIFYSGPPTVCQDAADANDDSGPGGNLPDVSDVVFIIEYQFNGGSAPLNPGPTTCGIDPTDVDLLVCEANQTSC
jgi:hypothetical protein